MEFRYKDLLFTILSELTMSDEYRYDIVLSCGKNHVDSEKGLTAEQVWPWMHERLDW